jgi:hypothetical protein
LSDIIQDEKDTNSPTPLSPVDRPTLNIQKIGPKKDNLSNKVSRILEERSESKTAENGPGTLTPNREFATSPIMSSFKLKNVTEIDEVGMVH